MLAIWKQPKQQERAVPYQITPAESALLLDEDNNDSTAVPDYPIGNLNTVNLNLDPNIDLNFNPSHHHTITPHACANGDSEQSLKKHAALLQTLIPKPDHSLPKTDPKHEHNPNFYPNHRKWMV